MSQGNICKHCRYYEENHIDEACPNGSFDLLTLEDQLKDKPEWLSFFSGVNEAKMREQIQDDFRRGVRRW